MKQHVTPLIVRAKKASRLERVPLQTSSYDENWIQQLCYENPTLLPIEDIEPSFGGIVSVCRELQTESGPCDLIYLNDDGFITVGECKLWRNPEARRKAIGQVLDYAKDLCKWSYSKFEQECLKARKGSESSLYSIVAQETPDLDEAEFIDRVQRNLTLGRFLLLIIGDGIRENMEGLVQYIQGQGALYFSLALLEIPVFKTPDTGDLLVTPRVLMKTKELERTIVRVVDKIPSSASEGPDETPPVSTTISEKVFYDRLASARGNAVAGSLAEFMSELRKDLGVSGKLGRGKRLSFNIKSPQDTFNFGSIQETGEVWFYGIVTKTEQLGDRQIGLNYLHHVAKLVDGEVDQTLKQWGWGVKRQGQYLMIDSYLSHRSEWKAVIQGTLQEVQEKEEA